MNINTYITKSAKNELEMHALSLNIQQISWQQYLWYIFITKHAVSSHRTATVIKLQLTLNDSEVKWWHLGFNYLSVWLFLTSLLYCIVINPQPVSHMVTDKRPAWWNFLILMNNSCLIPLALRQVYEKHFIKYIINYTCTH